MRSKDAIIIVDDFIGDPWLEPAAGCPAGITAETLLRSCSNVVVPPVRVSDPGRNFNIRDLRLVAEALDTSHRSLVANSSWTYGTVEDVVREIQ